MQYSMTTIVLQYSEIIINGYICSFDSRARESRGYRISIRYCLQKSAGNGKTQMVSIALSNAGIMLNR